MYVDPVVVQHRPVFMTDFCWVRRKVKFVHSFNNHVQLCVVIFCVLRYQTAITLSLHKYLTQREAVFVYNNDFVPSATCKCFMTRHNHHELHHMQDFQITQS